MLRTQETLVISAVSSHWFHVEVTRSMRLLIGVTNDGRRLQPDSLEDMRFLQVDVERGDKVKLLVTPSLGYGPCTMGPLRQIVEGCEGREDLEASVAVALRE